LVIVRFPFIVGNGKSSAHYSVSFQDADLNKLIVGLESNTSSRTFKLEINDVGVKAFCQAGRRHPRLRRIQLFMI
jgi:hypothetical protein